MGLIKAISNSVSSGIGDQFKEFITCPPVNNDVVVQRGVVQHGQANTNPTNGVISNGSAIVVPDGMSMMIVDNGKIVEFSAEPGTYTYDSSSEPSIFYGSLGKAIVDSIKTIGQRITFGGLAPKDQRVYYINIKQMVGNTFGSTQPEPIADPVYGSVEITYNGDYAVRVADPVVVVSKFTGSNPKDTLTLNDIFTSDSMGGSNQLKGKVAQNASVVISKVMLMNNVSFNRIQLYKTDLTQELGNILNGELLEKYGLEICDLNIRVNASDSSRKIVQEMDAKIAETTRMGQVYSNNMTGTMAAATGEAMKAAASNENGSMMGFMGMGMAQQQGANVMTAAASIQPAAPVVEQNVGTPEPGTIFGTPAPVSEPVNEVTETPVEETNAPAEVPVDQANNSQPQDGGLAFCPDCGAQKVGKFCIQCGKQLD